jgi:hypothetical protein
MLRRSTMVLLFVLTSCSAGQVVSGPDTSAEPAPPPEAELAQGDNVVLAWQSETRDYVTYYVVVEIMNQGGGWGQLSPFGSDYTVLDSSGGIVTTGSFIYAYPEFVGPGETAYLVDYSIDESGIRPNQFASVQAKVRYDDVDEPDVTFDVADITWRRESSGGGLIATGFVTATAHVSDAAVAVLCFDGEGNVIGVTTTNLVQNVMAGERKAFETVVPTPPRAASQCASSAGLVQGHRVPSVARCAREGCALDDVDGRNE